ncbi:MAG TPA: glycosyltransferase family 2 protein [Candidatus Sulfotelmatobacter sp.]|nr:glycosyltransferase family 2 protein [Candidatus Sulfotelmatobacter sp.]
MSAQKAQLSLALIVKNEARCLARCLRSVQSVVDEIVVVDTGSTDDTIRIAREFQAKTSHFAWVDDFSAARNHALAQTTGEWILVLDADEYASEALALEIAQFTRGRPAIGKLRIVSTFRRHNQTLSSQSFVSRLFPRGAHFEGRIHEQLISPLPRVALKGELGHDGYLETQKSDRNINLLLRELEVSPDNAYYFFQLAIEYSSLEQTEKAFGCLERAFALARSDAAFAPNLVVDYLYAILELKRFEVGLAVIAQASGFLQDFPDFHLVCGLFYMNLVRSNSAKYIAYLPQIEQSFQRCLALGETEKFKSVRGTGTFLAHYNLGTLYHVFGDAAGARRCFEQAARLGYDPAIQILKTFKS